MLIKEEWRDIEKYTNYEISNKGKIRNKRKNIFKKPSVNKYGFLYINLYKNGIGKKHFIHTLCIKAFSQKRPSKVYEVCHIDKNKLNNDIENLKWMTKKEIMNFLNVKSYQGNNKGECNGGCKLTNQQVKEIIIKLKSYYIDNKNLIKKLSIEYNVSTTTILNILKNRSWQHIKRFI